MSMGEQAIRMLGLHGSMGDNVQAFSEREFHADGGAVGMPPHMRNRHKKGGMCHNNGGAISAEPYGRMKGCGKKKVKMQA